MFYKIRKTGLLEDIFNIPQTKHQSNTQSIEDVTIFYCRTDVFKYSYFPHAILEWNKLDMQIRTSESFLSFNNCLLKIGQPTAKPTCNIHNPKQYVLQLPHAITCLYPFFTSKNIF